MNIENISTLKIHKLTQKQYNRELESGNIDENALYLTPDEEIDLTPYATKEDVSSTYETKSDAEEKHENLQSEIDSIVKNIVDGRGEHSIQSPINAAAISDNNIAIGNIVSAGCKGYYIKSIDTNAKKIYLTDIKVLPVISDADNTDTSFITPGYRVEEQFNIINGSHYPLCGTIKGISNNVVTYESNYLGFDTIVSDDGIDGHTFYVPSQPDIGIVSFGDNTVVFGDGNRGSSKGSIVAGRDNTSVSNYAAVFGRGNIAGYADFATGRNNQATGMDSAAIGHGNKATALNAVAIGGSNKATNRSAFASGNGTESNGFASHTEGIGTKASSNYQHAQGKFNKEDTEGRYAHIVGSGADDNNRWNAHTVDWDGNAWYRGEVYVGGSDQDNSYKLAKTYEVDAVNDKINAINKGLDLKTPNYRGLLINNTLCLSYVSGKPVTTPSIVVVGDTALIDETTDIKFYSVEANANTSNILGFSNTNVFPPIPIKNDKVYFKVLMRTNKAGIIPAIRLTVYTDENGNQITPNTKDYLTSSSVVATVGDCTWEQFIISFSGFRGDAAGIKQVHFRFAGGDTTGQQVIDTFGSDTYFDIAGWAAFDSLELAESYDLTKDASDINKYGYNVQGQIDAKASKDLSNIDNEVLKGKLAEIGYNLDLSVKIATGSYVGTGSDYASRSLTFNFKPKLVILGAPTPASEGWSWQGGILTTEGDINSYYSGGTLAGTFNNELIENSDGTFTFKWKLYDSSNGVPWNDSACTYSYIAIG